MISPAEAELLINGWRESATPLYVVTVVPGFCTLQFVAAVAAFDKGSHGALLTLEGDSDRLRCSFGLTDATFEYADDRSTLPMLTRDISLRSAKCAMKIAYSNGALTVLVEEQHPS